MNCSLKDKVIIVTGSSRGIGLSIAESIAAHGAIPILNARGTVKLEESSRKIPNAYPVAADVSVLKHAEELVNRVYEKFGKINGLVCNVGTGKSVQPGQETFAEWQKIFAINLWSTTNMVEASKRHLADTRGSIVCISSICGEDVIPEAPITYSVAKAALNAYVRGVARPLGHLGIRINAIAAGNILFEDSSWDEKLKIDPVAVRSMLEREVSLGRLGSPDEIACTACFLLSDCSTFTTGSIFRVDGGQARG